jgi:SHS2 domain-containing protein
VYELFDHTADLGLRVQAPTLEALLVEAARGLFSIIVEDIPHDGPAQRRTFEILADRPDWLLFDWLNALLYTFDTEHLLFDDFEVRLVPGGLEAEARAHRFDPTRHPRLHEVKAITYHGLAVEQTSEGFRAELIVDI